MPTQAPGGEKFEAAFKDFQAAVAPIIGAGVEVPPGLTTSMQQFIDAALALQQAEDIPIRTSPTREAQTNIARKRGDLTRAVMGMKREVDTLKGIYPGNDGTLNLALSNYSEVVAKQANISLGTGVTG